MDFRALRYFVKIVELGSLSRAAESLHIAQPALSHQLAMLEEELDTRLMSRSSKGVKPTAAGLTLYRNAQVMLRQLEQTRLEVRSEKQSVAGRVSIGLPTSTAAVLALPLLVAVREKYPAIELEINDNGSGLLAELLVNGRLDLTMLFVDKAMRSVKALHLLTEELCLVSPISTCAAVGSTEAPGTISLADIENVGLVISTTSNGLRQLVDQSFNGIAIKPRLIAELNTVTLLKDAVIANVASTILPMSAVAHEWHAGALHVRRIVEPVIARPISLCSNSNIPLSAAAEAVHLLVVQTVEELVQSGVWQNVTRIPVR
jgi:LysR family nitrogen assimilation transcriptional regulator